VLTVLVGLVMSPVITLMFGVALLADWPERPAIRYAMLRDANSLPSVVAPPLGGVLTRVHRKRPPRKRRPLFSFPGRLRGLKPEGLPWTPNVRK